MNARQIAGAVLEDDEDPKDYVMRSLPGLKKFLVICWDSDQKQCSWDIVMATDTDAAIQEVAAVRGYAEVVDALGIDEMVSWLRQFGQRSPAAIIADWNALKEEFKESDE